MSVFQNLMEDLQKICEATNVNFEEIKKELELVIGKEELVAYLFGQGMAPDNPNTVFDLLVIGQEHLFSLDKEKNGLNLSYDKLSKYSLSSIRKQENRIKFEMRQTGSLYQFYLNNPKSEESVVMDFYKKLREVL